MEMDQPRLDVRLPGLEDRSPRRLMLSSTGDLRRPEDIAALPAVDHLFVEGGAETASAFLRADLVDRLLLYRAPILIGAGTPALGDIGLTQLGDAHGRWKLADSRMLGSDRLEVYERA
jgi:diaminohydroxyphosphoribosylaminopyrimidine deaminase/5-amino-6-(5-phosphoribosylamino)uracil reductase